jgi:DNA-binding NtrC family response regulator
LLRISAINRAGADEPAHAACGGQRWRAAIHKSRHRRRACFGLVSFGQTKPSSRVANPSKGELRKAIARCGGNQSRTADLLGIPRKRLRELLEFYDLPLPRG